MLLLGLLRPTVLGGACVECSWGSWWWLLARSAWTHKSGQCLHDHICCLLLASTTACTTSHARTCWRRAQLSSGAGGVAVLGCAGAALASVLRCLLPAGLLCGQNHTAALVCLWCSVVVGQMWV